MPVQCCPAVLIYEHFFLSFFDIHYLNLHVCIYSVLFSTLSHGVGALYISCINIIIVIIFSCKMKQIIFLRMLESDSGYCAFYQLTQYHKVVRSKACGEGSRALSSVRNLPSLKPSLDVHSAIFLPLDITHSVLTIAASWYAPLQLQQATCQTHAIGFAKMLMVVHGGDESNLMKATGGLVLLAIARCCWSAQRKRVCVHELRKFLWMSRAWTALFPVWYADSNAANRRPVWSWQHAAAHVWTSAAACTVHSYLIAVAGWFDIIVRCPQLHAKPHVGQCVI